ncbi:hypothetical protein GCM10023307_02570 [Lysobacter hankyongensis]|uniref:Uncharacterized protein n=1 Tax=Lysobacter hankyongensis TaxID=1176535 RepID=A0ABP9ALC5_9GAMM
MGVVGLDAGNAVAVAEPTGKDGGDRSAIIRAKPRFCLYEGVCAKTRKVSQIRETAATGVATAAARETAGISSEAAPHPR